MRRRPGGRNLVKIMPRHLMFVAWRGVVCSLILIFLNAAWEHVMPLSAQGHGSNLPHGIPDFSSRATSRAVQSGIWSNASTWSDGQVPGAGSVVRIPKDLTVTYNIVSDQPLTAIGVDGALIFRTDIPTRLTVRTLQILPAGRLEIGTAESPVSPTATAELVIADRAFDPTDPEQYGAGLIGLGRVRMHGREVAPTFARLAREPKTGDRSLTLAGTGSTAWSGARIVIPGTNQPVPSTSAYRPEWEERVVSGVKGTELQLDAPLNFDHRGARDADGRLEFLPHVGNLSRNVIVRSANPAGTRGHVLFTHRADVDIRYALFKDLGRTTIAPLDSAVADGSGHATRPGRNQIGRYSLHMHHLTGPRALTRGIPQFVLIGNAIDGGSKWGITVHNSHYGLVQGNVVYDVGGAGIVTEDGSETGNVIERNFVVRAWGTGGEDGNSRAALNDWAWEGAAFWFRGPSNYVRDNVAANANSFAVAYMMLRVSDVRVPTKAGDDPHRATDMNRQPILEFSNNEVYASYGGLTLWNLGASCCADVFELPESTVRSLRLWHIRKGYYGYASNRVVFDGWIQRGDVRALVNPNESVMGFSFGDYLARNTTIRNSDLQGLRVGIAAPVKAGDVRDIYGAKLGTLVVENTILRNIVDVVATTQFGVTGGGTNLPGRRTILRDVRFGSVNAPPQTDPQQHIVMAFNPTAPNANAFVTDEVIVFDHNGTRGENFQVYYAEQAPSFVIPPTAGASQGMTNADSWTRHHRAIGGAVAPCTDRRQGVVGFVCPLTSTAIKP
jgi:hypothetical protein